MDDASKLTASSGDANDKLDNFAVFESPAKLAAQANLEAQAKRGSAVANKEVVAAHKRKPDAATVSPQKKRQSPAKRSSSPTPTREMTMTRTSLRRVERHWIATPSTSDGPRQQ